MRTFAQLSMAASPAVVASGATVAQQISPKSIYIHLGQTQTFVSPGATKWAATEGIITAGVYLAPTVMPKSNMATVTATGPGGSASATVTLVSGAVQTVAPATATLNLGAKLQFASSGVTTWSAVFGTITSSGLYTAPTVWPQYGTDSIIANGIHGSGRATVTINIPTPVITRVGSGGQIPLGLFSVTIGGTGLTYSSLAYLGNTLLHTTYAAGQLKIAGFSSKVGPSTIKVTNKTLNSNVFPVTVGVAKPKVSAAAARRFLEEAAFGPSPSEAENLQNLGIPAWIKQQFNSTWFSQYNGVASTQGGMPEHFLTNAVMGPDQLRQRVAFALSQIFVTSLDRLVGNANMVSYQNMLLKDAFTNYRTIMEDVTLSPAMGQYLDMANNAKADPNAGSVANENYARELMQLFTIGTNMLNADGTLQYDSNQLPIPTYSQFTVTEFARVYTGWTYHPAPGKPVAWNTYVNSYGNLVPYAAEHDSGSKQLLSGYIAPAGATPKADLDNALNNIFNHPNVPPFVCRQLIQHLVKSNPTTAYVGRVAAVFKNNGSGVRGDMKAVINAILTDPEARANDEGGDDLATDGHLQEPALFIAAMVRAFGGQMTDQNYYAYDLANMGQDVFSPPSVFNYYAPNSGAPGTSLTGGEFGIYSPNNAILRANLVSYLFNQYSNPVQTYGPGVTVDLSGFMSLSGNPASLVNALDLTLTHGTMPAEMKAPIVAAVTAETGGGLRRIQRACYLILTSSYYNVWH
jgi:hypothetical protein